MTDDATAQDTTSTEAESTETSSEPESTTESEQIASMRKRQAGAEAARQKAVEERDELRKKVAEYEAANQTAAQKELSDLARAEARAAAAETRAAEAEARAEAKILDARFPNARKELPEVTDEVKLAKFEAMLRDEPEVSETPTPRGTNPSKDGNGGGAEAKPRTSADELATLKTMTPPWQQ